MTPTLLALLIQALACLLVWHYARTRLHLPFIPLALFVLISLPAPVLWRMPVVIKAADLLLPVLAIVALSNGAAHLRDKLLRRVLIALLCGIFLWPIISTYYAVGYLGESIAYDRFVLQILRIANCAICVWLGYRAGIRTERPLLLVYIPVLLWACYLMAAILQQRGFIDVEVGRYIWPGSQLTEPLRLPVPLFMGYSKAEVGAWAATCSVFAAIVIVADKGWVRLLALFVPALSLYVTIGAAARTGAAATIAAFLVTCVILSFVPQARPKLLLPLCIGVLAVPLFGIWFNSLGARSQTFLESKFSVVTKTESAGDLVEKRDQFTIPLIQYLFSHPDRIAVGSGVGTEKIGAAYKGGSNNVDGMRTWAEPEWLRILVSGGIVTLVAYIYALALFIRSILATPFRANPFGVAIVIGLATGGAILSFSQFYMFSALNSNSPTIYLLWASYSVMLGVAARFGVVRLPRRGVALEDPALSRA